MDEGFAPIAYLNNKDLVFNIMELDILSYACNHSFSIKAAAPMPVPMHIETTPLLVLVLCSSGIKVAICRAPELKIKYLCSPMGDPGQ